MSTKVTFVAESLVGAVSQALPDHTAIGAQYEVERADTKVYAVLWSYEPLPGTHPGHSVYNPVDEWRVIDNLPVGAITLDFHDALPTLADVFGLHIPCVTPKT